ncbi:glycosyltransferase [Moraxella sp. ZY210820]|uniref:glycosyltransferase n=1 Tax=Moraxella sp. ZY210820 TaxID=2904123 RepID=UPI00351ED017
MGRAELERAILSVQQQQYPCKHYVFVDGKQYFDKIQALEEKYPDVIFTYLPMNTGANGWTNSYINTIAPFLIKEDIICYLDDDNWYQPEHTQVIANAFTQYEIDVAYTLRCFMTEQGEYICDDNSESLGFYHFEEFGCEITFNNYHRRIGLKVHRGFLVDTNCLAMTIQTARELAHYWTYSQQNDAYVWQQCLQQKKSIMATAQYTVNYVVNIKSYLLQIFYDDFEVQDHQKVEFFHKILKAWNQNVLDRPETKGWHIPSLYIDGKLHML